jgi:hypothetical protein
MAQTFKYTVVGDTQPAVKGNEALDASINKVDASTKQLQSDTDALAKKQREQGEAANKAFSTQLENKIKTSDSLIKGLGGTVSLLTGTLTTVVGTLGLFGVDDEQIAGFQKAALSVLALSTGITQQITGLKDVTEAQKLQNEVTQASVNINRLASESENTNTVALAANKDAVTGVTAAFGSAAISIAGETTSTAANTNAKAINSGAEAVNTTTKTANTVATRINTIAQIALNTAIKANPYLAIGSILISVATLIFGVTSALFSNTEAEEDNTEAKEQNERAIKAQKDATDALTKSRGLSDVQIAKQQVLEAKGDKAQAERQLLLARQESKFSTETEEARIALIDATTALTNAQTDLTIAEENAREKAKDDARTAADKAKALRDERLEREGIIQLIQLEIQAAKEFLFPENQTGLFDINNLKSVDDALKSINITLEEIDLEEPVKFLSEEQLTILKRLRGELNSTLKQQLFDREQQYNDEIALFANNENAKTQLTEEYEKDRNKIRLQYAAELASQVLGTTNTLLSELGNLQQEAINIELDKLERKYQRDLQLAGENQKLKESLTRGFEARELEIQKQALKQQKALRTAQVATTTAESVINAYNSTSQLPPPFNFIAGTALAAAYTVLGAKAIANINAVSLDNGSLGTGGFNNIPSGGGFSLPGGGGISTSPSLGAILPGIGGGRIATPTIGTIAEPIRAYVLTGDISNGMQAGIALNNRRRLSGG